MSEGGGDGGPRVESGPPAHLIRLYRNLQVLPALEAVVVLPNSTEKSSISAIDQPLPIDKPGSSLVSEKQSQSGAMHVQREQEKDRQENEMHTLREAEIVQEELDRPKQIEAMHVKREEERDLEIEGNILQKTRIGLSAIEAWARKDSIDPKDIQEITKFTNRLKTFLYDYAEKGTVGYTMFIDAAAKKFITEDMVDKIYGGNEDKSIMIDNQDNSDEVRKLIATIVGHDIRTPITSMVGRVSLLQRGLPTEERRIAAEESIHNSIENLVNEAIFAQEMIAEKLPKEEFTGEQLAQACIKYLGENTVVQVSEEARAALIYSSDKWLSRLLLNARRNTDDQYDIRDEHYPKRKDEKDVSDKPTLGKMYVTIDVIINDVGDQKMEICVGDVATGFPPKRLKEKFVRRGTDKADRGGTGMGIASCVAMGNKVYLYGIEPQSVVRDANGNVIKIIQYFDSWDKNGFFESEKKDGDAAEKEISEDEAQIGNIPFGGAQTRIHAPLIQ